MNRNCIKVCYNTHCTTLIYVDEENANELLPYLINNDSVFKEFKIIRDLLLENQRNREKYCKADVSGKADKVFEMRFTGSGRNDRIYCLEIHEKSSRHIVMVELFKSKKSQSISKKIKSRLENIGRYRYEFR